MTIEPDTKDWTWVLDKPCPDCGFDATSVSFDAIPGLTLENAAQWARVLQRDDVAERPRPDVWSPLEYACHVRDVFRLFNMRLGVMTNEDEPRFANWDQDETALSERYGEQEPADVGRGLAEAAEVISSSFAAVSPDQLGRRGFRSDGAEFTIDSFARYFIHDPVHHLWDVTPHSGEVGNL